MDFARSQGVQMVPTGSRTPIEADCVLQIVQGHWPQLEALAVNNDLSIENME